MSQVTRGDAQRKSSSAKSSATGLSRLLPGKSSAESGPDDVQRKASNFLSLWKATENEGSVLKRLIKIVASQPKTELESVEITSGPADRAQAPTSAKPLLAVSEMPIQPVEQTPQVVGTSTIPPTQSQCDPSYLEQPESTFLAHTDGPSPMVVVPDSPYIHRRISRAAKAAQPPKPEPEWHGIGIDDPAQTSQQRVLEDMPSPDELRQLTTGKHRTVAEPDERVVPVQSKISRMTPERSSSERAQMFFTELKIKIKELFAPRL